MNCVFGPYKVTSSSFPDEGTTFVDMSKTRLVAIVSSCDSTIIAPCEGAIAISQTICEESNCNIRWYECPSVLGRTYTIFPTPCGVTITSFEDGLLSLNGCSATSFGSSTFCFGRIYTSAGDFTGNPHIVSFELDGHTFVVEGVSGECNEFLDCGPCSQISEGVTTFASLPTAPPETADEDIEIEVAPDDEVVPETEVIQSENRTVWHNVPELGPPDTGTGTQCDEEINVSSWETPETTPTASVCDSNDNPSIAVLPSGHTIIAYEDRSVEGLARIRVAILKSSVNKNIVYHRRLSKGTLINDPKNAQQTFEVFEEMSIGTDVLDHPADTSLTIGFLSGPLVGAKPDCTTNCLYSISTIVRSVENNRVKHTITFAPDVPTVFPDQNDISDVSWFLADEAGGDIPPDSSNVITILDADLTAHKFPTDASGVQVPVANPSIAVARNNQMISSEQSIFLVYQAFEVNQWRVYLRQIILGGISEIAPTYSLPYLFPDQSPVTIMSLGAGRVSSFAITIIFNDTFNYYKIESENLESTNEWQRIETPLDYIAGSILPAYENQSLLLCKNRNPVFPLSGCRPQGDTTCRLEFGTDSGGLQLECDKTGTSNSAQPWIKSFYSSTIPAEDIFGNGYLRSKLIIEFSIEQGINTNYFPEVWFLMGRTAPTSDFHNGWRIRVERHNGPAEFGNDANRISSCSNTTGGGDGLANCGNNCFIISIYNGWDHGGPWPLRQESSGTRHDLWRRQIKVCVNTLNGAGDYLTADWNTLSVETYLRGRHRVFKVLLNNANNTNYELVEFSEIDESTFNSTTEVDSEPIIFGKYYGFGFINHDVPMRSSINQITLTIPEEVDGSKHIFYEEFFDYDWLDMGRQPALSVRPTRYLSQVATEPNTAWGLLGYNYSNLLLCNRTLDTRYPRTPGFNTLVDAGFGFTSYDHLTVELGQQCTTEIIASPAFWSILKVEVPAELRQNKPSPFNPIYNTTIYASFSHGDYITGNGEQWGHIWFLMRQASVSSAWNTAWRLRVRYYLVGGVRTYNLQVYDGDTAPGEPGDVPVDSTIISPAVTATTLFPHTSNNPSGSPAPHREAIIPYLRVDITTDLTETKIDLYEAPKVALATGTQPSEYPYTLVHSFTGLDKKHFGSYYGLALFSGATVNDDVDVSRDWRSQPIVDYLQIRSFDDDPTPPIGSCCRAVGGCEDTTENKCISPDTWDATELCADRDCTIDFAYGAACRSSDGACVSAPEAGVPTDFDQAGTPGEWLEGKNCILGDADYRACVIPTGSCCKPDGTCSDGDTKAECEVFWGLSFQNSYWVKDGLCADVTCAPAPSARGACCIDSYIGCHAVVTALQCSNLEGTFLGVGTDCTSCVGACCHSGGCADTYQYDCLANNTTPVWFGNGTVCGEVPCGDSTSDCCFSDGQCGIIPEAVCTNIFYGTWNATGSCDPNTCTQPPGACCDPLTGSCSQQTLDDCNVLGRTFIGGACESDTCSQPDGACCINGVCSQKNLIDCVANDGVYFGDHTQCLPDHCDLQDPYIARNVNYKPEDLWIIQTGDNDFVTRVLYHMQEDNLLSNVALDPLDAKENAVDFMFIIDHSNSMGDVIQAVSNAVPTLAATLINKGLDVKFSLVIMARGVGASPLADTKIFCDDKSSHNIDSYMFNGLQVSLVCNDNAIDPPESIEEVVGGWTKEVSKLQEALNCWWIFQGNAATYAAIQFGIEDDAFNDATNGWRSDSEKFIFLITDTTPDECQCNTCDGEYTNNRTDATNSLLNFHSSGVTLIPAVCTKAMSFEEPCGQGGDVFAEMSAETGWRGEIFNVSTENYGDIFESLVTQIDIIVRQRRATVMERATPGGAATFLKQAEVIISYDGDLSDLWTFNKTDFEFREAHAPFPGTTTKQLSNFPFALASGKTYGVDAVHLQGVPDNWVSFGKEGSLQFAVSNNVPQVGTRTSAVADPILMAANSTRPKVFVNNRNQVIVAYESYESGSSQISIKGTGDFYQNSITGPKGSRLQRFYVPSEFSFNHAITLDGEGVNQLCDFVIDSSDITHITWQSSRDNEWEIYYANSSNLFEPVRITKADSRSSMPSIDIEETGNIFVVYHDNRFGPFEVMLATKTEERVQALLEQDAYMASMRHNFIHYTNTMPVVISNPVASMFVQTGQLWASKIADSPGNDNENYVYKLAQDTGIPSEGGASGFGMDHIAFHPDGRLYGIRVIKDTPLNFGQFVGQDQATLYLISDFSDGGEPEITTTPTVIGDIDLTVWDNLHIDRITGRILDIDFDSFGRLWLYMWNRDVANSGAGAFKWIDVTNASVKAETFDFLIFAAAGEPTFAPFLGTRSNAFAIDSNNNFVWGGILLWISSYPIVTNDILDPTGPKLAILDLLTTVVPEMTGGAVLFTDSRDGSTMHLESMIFNELDQLLIVDKDNDLFLYPMTGTVAQFLAPLSTDSHQFAGPLPVGTTDSIAFLQSSTGSKITGEGDFFHVLVQFFDNFAMVGEPYLTIDSRENLEAFVTEESIEDPYDPYLVTGMDARGIFLDQGQTGIIFFDATQFRPGFPRQSIPYSFEPNQTYFPKVFSINSSNAITETVKQNSSFSCSKCSRFGTNNFDSSGCSYSFVVTNISGRDQWYNFQVDFYADVHKQHLLRRFELVGGNADLQFAEVDNQAAISMWGSVGLYIAPDDAVFVQVYPSLDINTGFLCGINYSIQVNQCFSGVEEECSDFAILTPKNWDAIDVQGTEQISTDFIPINTRQTQIRETDPVAIGMDLHSIGGKIAVAYRTENNNLAYVTYDGFESWTNDLIASDITNGLSGYVSLGTSQGKAAVVFTVGQNPGGGLFHNVHLRSRIFNGVGWEDGGINANNFVTLTFRPITIFDETDPLTAITPRSTSVTEQYHIGANSNPSIIEHFSLFASITSDFCDTATINGSPYCVFWRSNLLTMAVRQASAGTLNADWDFFTVDDEVGWSRVDSNPVRWETSGRPAIVELANGLIAVAYIKQDDAAAVVDASMPIDATKRRLKFRTSSGGGWTDVDTGVGRDTYNKSLAMEIVNGQPYITYTIDKGEGKCDLKVAIYNGTDFQHETVAEGISTQSPQVDIIEFQSRAVITITASPLIIYLQRRDSLVTFGEISSTFFCECSSKIFPDRMVHLAEISRWEASAHGYSDTRVTESPKNSLRPKVAVRSTGTAIVVWEDNNCEPFPCIKAATFRNINQDQLRSSGTGSWYDFDFNTSGQQPDLVLDIYDRAVTTYEKSIASSSESFFGTQTIKEELPTNEVWSRVCDFDPEQAPGSDEAIAGGCDIEEIKANVITVDEFVSSRIVKKIRVKDEFVQYYTYNASGRLTAVVSNCEITLEIHGTPEIVALRFRNENQTNFGSWCPWSPQVGDFVTEQRHKLSGNTGIKEVCVQAMTYVGVTVQFCVPIIADYETVVFETRFYKNTFGDSPEGFQALDGEEFSNDDSLLEELPLADGLAVANLAPQAAINIVSPPSELVILVEIIPNKDPEEDTISIDYDVLQQGSSDTPGLTAAKGKNNDGKITFRGFFTIKREDKILNIDGLARVSPKFPQVCDESVSRSGVAINLYNPDQYNVISRESEVEITEVTDVLESYRQNVSGRVGVNIDIRSQEDPYFVFGDPNYSLRQQKGERLGVPLQIPADIFGLGLGLAPSDPCFGKVCPPDFRCDSATGNCVARVISG